MLGRDRNKTRLPSRRAYLLEELEPRLLLSADLLPFADLAGLTTPFTDDAPTSELQQFMGDDPSAESIGSEVPPDIFQNASSFEESTLELAAALNGAMGQAHAELDADRDATKEDNEITRREVVVIDPSTPDYQGLLDDLKSSRRAGAEVDVVVLDGERDGVAQITEILSRHRQLDAVHLVSHGNDGVLKLGSNHLDAARLAADASDVAAWANALNEEADLLIYGCDLAAGESGRALAAELRTLTGADVAASTDRTGNEGRGGDWDLEFRAGRIEAQIAFSPEFQQSWRGILEADVRLHYGEGSNADMRLRTFDDGAGTWSLESTSSTAGSTVKWSVNKAAPDGSTELVAVLSDSGGGTELDMMRWDGSAWSVDWTATDITSTNADKRGVDIAFEQNSGNAIAVYSNNTNNPVYRVWDASAGTWSAETSIFSPPSPGTGTALWVELASRPGSNEVALAYSDSNDDLHAVIWDGTSWDEANAQTLEANLALTNSGQPGDYRTFDVAYENSGDLMVAWGVGNDVDYSTKAAGSSTWSNPAAFSLVSGRITFVDLAAEPGGDRIAFAGIDDNNGTERLGLMTWDGSAWLDAGEYDNAFDHVETDGFGEFWAGVGWVGTSGEAVAVYSDQDAGAINWANWTASSGWAVQPDVAAAGVDLLRSVQIESYTDQDKLMAVFSDQSGNLWASTYDGASWSVTNGGSALEANISDAKTVPFGFTTHAVNTPTISGTIYEDVDGDGDVLDDGVAVSGATVSLYHDDGDGVPDAGDAFITSTTTDASGNYLFRGLLNDTYYVAVDSKSVSPSAGLNASFALGDVWAEQTYGSTGSVSFDGAYGFSTSDGPFFGGLQGGISDDASALTTAEHVTRVVVSGSTVTGVDSGFSFNVVTNTLGGDAQDDDAGANRTVQGSLRQFIQNANAIAGANAMRFVPATATNATDGGGNDWWRLSVTQLLPQVTDTATTLDGTAYDAADGVSVLDTNAGTLGYAGPVGLGADALIGTGDELALAGVARPELEIVNDRATNVVVRGLDLQADNITVRGLGIYGFGDADVFDDANIRVGLRSDPTLEYTGTLLEDNVLGSGVDGFTDPGAGARTAFHNIGVLHADGGTIRNNLIGFAGYLGVMLNGGADNWTVQGNEIRGTGLVAADYDAIDIGSDSRDATVTGNLFAANQGVGVDSWKGLGGNTIENNTFEQNGLGGVETSALRIFGTASTIRLNDIHDSQGAGVLVVGDIGVTGSPSTQNLISQNRFANNGANAIDLVAAGGDGQLGDGISLNDDSTDPQAGNIGLDYPVIASAEKDGATTTITGTTGAGFTVELYRAVAGAGDTSGTDDYGEGVEYLGTAVADGSGNFSLGTSALAAGDAVSVIAIDGSNNTSEFAQNYTVTEVNDAPVNTVPGAQTTGEDTALVFSAANGNQISVSDVDAAGNPLEVTLSVTNGTLTLATTTGLTFTAGADATSSMTFEGTIADINTALDGLTYDPAPDYNGSDTLTITTNDLGNTGSGGAKSDTDSVDITVNAINDAPVLDLDADDSSGATGADFTASFTEDGGPVAVADADASLGDVDDADLASLTVTITNLRDGAAEVLDADVTGTSITKSYDPATGVLTLSGADSVANYEQVLRTVTYDNASEDPDTTDRSVTFVANDGTDDSNVGTTTLTVNAANDEPVVSASADDPTFTERGAPASLYSGASVDPVESTQSIDELVLTITNVADGADEILHVDGEAVALTDGNTVTTAANGYGVSVTLAGTDATVTLDTTGATAAEAEALIDGLAYENTSDDPDTADRVVTLTSVQDSGGTADGGDDTANPNIASTVTVTALNDAPVLDLDADDSSGATGADFTASFTEDGGPVAVADVDASLGDVDDTDLASLTVTITNLRDGAAEVLDADVTGTSITKSYDPATGVLTLSGADSVANYEQVLRTVTYDNASEDPDTTDRSITFVANDGTDDSNVGTTTLAVNAVNDDPALTTNAPLAVDQNGTATITPDELEVTDADNTVSEITYTLDSAPANGTLRLSGAALGAGATFTQADIDAGRVTYTHDGSATDSDEFAFIVSDGSGGNLGTNTFDIAVGGSNTAAIVAGSGGGSTAGPAPGPAPLASTEPDDDQPAEQPEDEVTLAFVLPSLTEIPDAELDAEPLAQPRSVARAPTGTNRDDDGAHRTGPHSDARELLLAQARQLQAHLAQYTPEAPEPAGQRPILERALLRALDDLVFQMSSNEDPDVGEREVAFRVAAGAGLTLSAGFLAWLLRAGSLLAGALSTMPLWKGFDPLPVLAAAGRRRGKDRQTVSEKRPEPKGSEDEPELRKVLDPDEPRTRRAGETGAER